MEFLQKKLGIAVNQLAQDLLSRKEGDRIPPSQSIRNGLIPPGAPFRMPSPT